MGKINLQYKVAAVQAAPVYMDLDGTVEKTIRLLNEAAENGATLVAFPECFIPGYPVHIWLGSPAWVLGRGFVQRYFDNSLSYDSPQAERLRQAVKKANVTAVFGLTERSLGSLYMAQWIVGPNGETIAKRRKLRASHIERTVFGEGDGSDLAVHDVPNIGRLGALNCWEHLQPLTKMAMYSQGEQVHVASWPALCVYEPSVHILSGEANNAATKVYAMEGSCFVIAPHSVISAEIIEELCDTPEKHELLKVGGGYSAIYGPDGASLAKPPPPGEEGILYAHIDLGAIGVAKSALDPVGHYSRPDVLRLLFNNKPLNRVEHFALPIDTTSKNFDGIQASSEAARSRETVPD